MTAPTLTEFLLARIDEDETYAIQAQTPSAWSYDGYGEFGPFVKGANVETEDSAQGMDIALYLVRVNPWRVLADCAARRGILERARASNGYWGYDIERLLALTYSDHPDYDEAWRP